MRRLWLIPAVLAAVVAGGCALSASLGRPVPVSDVLLAAVIVLSASVLGLVPAMLADANDPANAAQAGLGGTVVHMFLAMLLAGMAAVLGLVGDRNAFVWWLFAMYLASLAALVVILTGRVRGSAAAGAQGRNEASKP